MDAVLSFPNGVVLPGILHYKHEVYSSSTIKIGISNNGLSVVLQKKMILVFASIMLIMTLPFVILRTILLQSKILLVKRYENNNTFWSEQRLAELNIQASAMFLHENGKAPSDSKISFFWSNSKIFLDLWPLLSHQFENLWHLSSDTIQFWVPNAM